ncbi:phosphoribosylanthranilate isomerase [Dysgonomonadaceae bacterium zrk40]|nr:phosphoribosylanthranilate isomerase [Dysgonomonadaceae bacterium zrk40]
MLIKICGMRDAENIRAVEQLGVDWMGFIFYPGSSRYVGEKLSYAPEKVKRVGVFVNELQERVLEIASKNRLQIIQLHGSESPETCRFIQDAGFTVVKAFGMESDKPFPAPLVEQYRGSCDYFIFDTRTVQHGGSGKKFRWELLSSYRGETPFLLSGGIGPDDAAAIREFSHPQFIGIDLNSGFETAPAIKEYTRLQNFIKKIRYEQD